MSAISVEKQERERRCKERICSALQMVKEEHSEQETELRKVNIALSFVESGSEDEGSPVVRSYSEVSLVRLA